MNESTQTDFAASAQRFKEAVESLADLRSKVGIIDSFRAQQEKSTDSLSEWTSTLESVTNELSQVGNLGEQVLGSLNKAIAKATSALQQETVQAIHEDLTGFQAKSDAQHDATTKALASAVDDLVGVGELGKEILGLLQEVAASSANAAKQETVQAIHDDLRGLQAKSDARHDELTKALASAVDDLVGVGELGKEILGLLQEVVASSANAAKQEIVQAIHDDLTKLNGEYGDQQKSTQEAIQGLREELKSIHNAHSATQHELNEIQKKVRDLPSRIRRKHGL
ncbi:MAG: hypothetical protein OXB90_10110 [Acidimicrobiaceae bacterium]|nr:hypothetical protein [Acidimicrobiaceae bacterium]